MYPEVETYDRGFKSKSIMPAIFIEHCSRLQYLHLNKLVNFNFTFDDENDELFIHNFKITKLLSPKPIYYGIQVPSLLINADFNIEENALLSWKLFKAEVESFRFEYNREKNMSSSFEIVFYKTTIVGY